MHCLVDGRSHSTAFIHPRCAWEAVPSLAHGRGNHIASMIAGRPVGSKPSLCWIRVPRRAQVERVAV